MTPAGQLERRHGTCAGHSQRLDIVVLRDAQHAVEQRADGVREPVGLVAQHERHPRPRGFRSLRELEDVSEVSRSFLSRYENGAPMPVKNWPRDLRPYTCPQPWARSAKRL